MSRSLFIFCFIIFFLSCKNNNIIIVDEFPKILSLEGNSVNFFDKELGILSLYRIGDFYIVYSSANAGNNLMYVYSLEGEKLDSIFPIGRGPDEYLGISYNNIVETNENEIKIWILDYYTSKFKLVNLNKTLEKRNVYVDKEYNLREIVPNKDFRQMYFIDSMRLFAIEDSDYCKSMIIDLQYNKFEHIDKSNKIESSNNDFNPSQVYQCLSTYNPKHKKIAISYFNLPKIEFIDSTFTIYKTLYFKEYVPEHRVNKDFEYEEFYSSICSDEKFVYILYNRESEFAENDYSTSSILVFNWNAEPIYEFQISYASYITFDEVKKEIIATNFNLEENVVTFYPVGEYY